MELVHRAGMRTAATGWLRRLLLRSFIDIFEFRSNNIKETKCGMWLLNLGMRRAVGCGVLRSDDCRRQPSGEVQFDCLNCFSFVR
jgi:hypothetical protein